jgi:hypothetical protein
MNSAESDIIIIGDSSDDDNNSIGANGKVIATAPSQQNQIMDLTLPPVARSSPALQEDQGGDDTIGADEEDEASILSIASSSSSSSSCSGIPSL